jgi:DNA-binding response OmpR family regulator
VADKIRVLVVDDEPSVAKTVKFVLEADGFETDAVFNGGDCLKKIMEEDYDLVLLDVMMPKMNGWQVFEEIKNKKPEQKIAFLTVMEYSSTVRDKLEKDGLSACIRKPFENEELVNHVKEIATNS